MKLINDTLAALSIAAPQRFSNLTVYPLIAPADLDPDYLVLDEALRRKLASVTEVSSGGSVPELAFGNRCDGRRLRKGEGAPGGRHDHGRGAGAGRAGGAPCRVRHGGGQPESEKAHRRPPQPAILMGVPAAGRLRESRR